MNGRPRRRPRAAPLRRATARRAAPKRKSSTRSTKRKNRHRRRRAMAFRFDKLTVRAQEAVQRAHGLAQDHGNQQLAPLHLLAALLKEEQGLVKPLVQKIGANLKQL